MKTNPKMIKGPSLKTARAFMTCLLIHRTQMLRMCGFQDIFSFRQFLEICYGFYYLKISSLGCAQFSTYNKSKFHSLHVLVCCCAATCTEILSSLFQKFKKTVRDQSVNENNVASRRAFTVDFFKLQS